jgi:hypothetical protein
MGLDSAFIAGLASTVAAFVATLGMASSGDDSPVVTVDGPVVATPVAQCQAIARNPLGITLIGDSLTIDSLAEIKAVFDGARRPLCVNAQSGRRTIDAVAYLKTYRATGQLAPLVIIALGTNDTTTSNPDFNVAARSALGQTYPRPTVWAVGYRSTDLANSNRIAGLVGEWDAAIARLTSTRWGPVVVTHPEYLASDGIHPSDIGKVAYAGFLVAGIP